MTSKTDTAEWPADTDTGSDDSGDEAILDTAQFTAAGPPKITRPSRWAKFLWELEQRGLDEDIEDDQATLGPFDNPDQAYSVASRISRGKFPGAEPAGKFEATARTVEKTDRNGNVIRDEDGNPVKHTVVWAWLNPAYIEDPSLFSTNGDSAED